MQIVLLKGASAAQQVGETCGHLLAKLLSLSACLLRAPVVQQREVTPAAAFALAPSALLYLSRLVHDQNRIVAVENVVVDGDAVVDDDAAMSLAKRSHRVPVVHAHSHSNTAQGDPRGFDLVLGGAPNAFQSLAFATSRQTCQEAEAGSASQPVVQGCGQK